ncbi:MAG: tyrosine-protein kinase family protein [Gaiellales bacterium]
MGIDVPAAKRPALIDPGDAGAQPFREIDLCLGGGRNESGHVVVFASAWPGEGTTTVASNYAIAASRREQRVLLVDANLDGPSLHALFDVPRTPGLVDILSY